MLEYINTNTKSQVKMNYINTNTVIVVAQGVPQQHGKTSQSSYKYKNNQPIPRQTIGFDHQF